MIVIEVEPNPNCEPADYQIYQPAGDARRLRKMLLTRNGREEYFLVTGLEEKAVPCPAWAQKVADSGGGTSFLIFGGAWGLRFKSETQAGEPWDLGNKDQWGEPFKFYGDESDLVYGD